MGNVVQFIPRPNHKRDTDFPAIPFVVHQTLIPYSKDPITDHRDTPEPEDVA